MQLTNSNKAMKNNKVFVLQNYSSFFLVCIFLILSLNSYAERRACERSAKAIKILYGVQGTGNGHLTRARELGQSLKAAGVQVDFVFSGRNREDFVHEDHDLIFGSEAKYFKGLTFATENGKINNFQTILEGSKSLPRLINDIKNLDLKDYDLVISDFEPVSAWAAVFKKIPLYGIAHQYSFNHSKVPASLLMKYMVAPSMKLLAPVSKSKSIGLHFDSFQSLILPPMVAEVPNFERIKGKVTVNLAHESQSAVIAMLSPIQTHEFHIYADAKKFHNIDTRNLPKNIHLHPTSYENYRRDFYSSEAVIVNAGFGNQSQALKAGIHLLSKPIDGQPEQLANIKALEDLSYAKSIHQLDSNAVQSWLASIDGKKAIRIHYPKVSEILTDWLLKGAPEMDQKYVQEIWDKIKIER